MTFTLIRPIEKVEHSRFIPVHRDYNQPNSGYESSQQQKRNDNKDKTEASVVKSVRKDKKGNLLITYENGVVKKYSPKDSKYNIVQENLRSRDYSTNFDYKA